jgi:hypothetical protein
MQMAADFYEELRRNSKRLPLAAALDIPVKVIWGVNIRISLPRLAKNVRPASETVPFIRFRRVTGFNAISLSRSLKNSCHDRLRRRMD